MKSLLLMLGLFFAANLQAMEEPVTAPSVKFVKTSQEISAEKWQVRKEVITKRLAFLPGLLAIGHIIVTRWEFKKYKEIEKATLKAQGGILKAQGGILKTETDIFNDATKKSLPAIGIVGAVLGVAAVLIPPVYIKGKPFCLFYDGLSYSL